MQFNAFNSLNWLSNSFDLLLIQIQLSEVNDQAQLNAFDWLNWWFNWFYCHYLMIGMLLADCWVQFDAFSAINRSVKLLIWLPFQFRSLEMNDEAQLNGAAHEIGNWDGNYWWLMISDLIRFDAMGGGIFRIDICQSNRVSTLSDLIGWMCRRL